MFRFLGVKACIFDFNVEAGIDNGYNPLFNWVCNYYKTKTGNKNKFVPPLFLQHEGHSRTIAGIEKKSNGDFNLLILDPSCGGDWLYKKLQEGDLSVLRRGVSNLSKKMQYQIVAVLECRIMGETEKNASKYIESEIIK